MKNSPAALSVWNLVGRATNSFLFIVIANLYGTNQYTDWFFFIYAVAYFFIGISYFSTESALVSAWHKLPVDEHPDLFRAALHLSIYYCFLSFIAIGAAGLFFAPIYGIQYHHSVTKVIFICFVLSLQPSTAFISSFFSSYKQFQQKYIFPVLHLSFRTVGVLFFLLFFKNRTIVTLSLAYLFGEAVRLIFLADKKILSIFFDKKILNINLNKFKAVYSHVSWMTIALMGTVINPVIDLAMVGRFGDGSVTLVDYANRLRGIPVLALGGLTVYYLGEWSYQHNRTGDKIKWNVVRLALKKVMLLSFLFIVILTATESIWVPKIFFSKEFSPEAVYKLQTLLYWYFPGVLFLAGNSILSRAALVLQKEKLMAFITITASFGNVILNYFLLRKIGIEGVALSTTIVEFLSFSVLYIAVRKAIK